MLVIAFKGVKNRLVQIVQSLVSTESDPSPDGLTASQGNLENEYGFGHFTAHR